MMVAIADIGISGLAIGSVYALIAVGIVVIYNASGVVNFAQGAYAMAGAYATDLFAGTLGLPIWVAILLGVLVLGLLGLLTELLILRPMSGAPVVAVMMATLGILIIFRGVVLLAWGPDARPFPSPFGLGGVHVGSIYVSYTYLAAALASVIAAGFLLVFYRFTTLGLLQRCVADNPRAAVALGISIDRQVGTAWFLSCALAGFGGVLMAVLGGLHESISHIGLVAFPVVIFGGLTSAGGAVVAGLLLGLLEALTGGILVTVFERWLRLHTSIYSVGALQQVLPYLALIFVLLVRPQGLFGRAQRERL